jgi:MtN3 and saliva related transmembrane protein
MDLIWLIGFMASLCIIISIIPQTYKMWKMRREKLEEFHLLWFIFNILGCILFIWYGLLIDQIGLLILNSIGLISIILMYLIYKGIWIKL